MKFFSKRSWSRYEHRMLDQIDRAFERGRRAHEPGEGEATKIVLDLWVAHSKPYTSRGPGFGYIGQDWWCSTCGCRWPCDVAIKTSHYGQIGGAATAEYEPMRLIVKGEMDEDS